MTKSQHTHKYQLVKNGSKGNKVYRCMQPECNHWLTPEFVVGKRTICRYCSEEFIIARNTIGTPGRRRKYLQCGCRNEKKVEVSKSQVNAIDDLLKDVLQ